MKTKRIVPIFIVLAASLFFYLNLTPSTPDGFKDLTAAEANTQLAANPDVRIIDIRTPQEFASGHIKGAAIIDFYAPGFRQKWDTLDRDARYFIYCRSGNRSAQALPILADLGFTRIWHLSNGIISWKDAGLPLVW